MGNSHKFALLVKMVSNLNFLVQFGVPKNNPVVPKLSLNVLKFDNGCCHFETSFAICQRMLKPQHPF